jgi:hypothetical protein
METTDGASKQGPPWDLDDPAEVVRLAGEIHEGAERGKEIAAMRPDGASLGAALTSYVEMFERSVDLAAYKTAIGRKLIEDDHDPSWNGPPWSPASDAPADYEHRDLVALGWDHSWLQRDYDEDYGRVLYVVHRYADATLDHLRGIGTLLREATVIRPPVALARSALEGAAHVAHLCSSAHTGEERLAQTLNVELEHMKEELQAEQRAKNYEQCKELQSEIKLLTDVGRNHGFVPDQSDRSFHAPRLSSRKLTDLVLDQSDGRTWHLLSQFTHPLDDDGLRIVLGPSARTKRVQRDALVTQMALSAVLSAIRAREALSWYTGWDLAALKKIEDPLLELWAYGAGMRNDLYDALLSKTTEP